MTKDVRARFSIESWENGRILIRDDFDENDPTMTITNDVEAVVGWLNTHTCLLNNRLFYRDTEDQIDEIIHDGHGKFIKFSPGGYDVG